MIATPITAIAIKPVAPGRLHIVEAVAGGRHRSGQDEAEQQERQQISRCHTTVDDQNGTADQHDQQHERP
ncbi:hypothetical protein ACQPXH_14055 [Nocardia sp. CA-135953]|uniref:hypothetical protein n=1 Tax=Nocardia sp. CA-135953 TaxID=3239978 RepID=UPI003D98FF34